MMLMIKDIRMVMITMVTYLYHDVVEARELVRFLGVGGGVRHLGISDHDGVAYHRA